MRVFITLTIIVLIVTIFYIVQKVRKKLLDLIEELNTLSQKGNEKLKELEDLVFEKEILLTKEIAKLTKKQREQLVNELMKIQLYEHND